MCGIIGLWHPGLVNKDQQLLAPLTRMTESLRHRGPDASGIWCHPTLGIGLGHRRLSIIDLSPAGAQPMISGDGRWVLSYNGEIYNHQTLRQELAALGVVFRGHSDTEVILEGCAHWGVENTVSRLIGMFACVLWDHQDQTLILIRDRLGIKPLYWSNPPGVLLIGSELKALRRHPDFPHEVDRQALAAFLRWSYVPAPWTIHPHTWKVEPGCLLRFSADLKPHLTRYWVARDVAQYGVENPLSNLVEAEKDLETLLQDAVSRRMVADVPLGAFLSGGMDSSLVVALMQAHSSRPVKTFAIGFAEAGFDETPYAQAVARYLGTDHTEFRLAPVQALEIIPQLPEWFDEPFADTSQIPTYLVAKLARQEVTVALSGDGGDELFGGYDRYRLSRTFWAWAGKLPLGVRRLLARGIQGMPIPYWDGLARGLPNSLGLQNLGSKAHKAGFYLSLEDQFALYRQVVSQWTNPALLVPDSQEYCGPMWDSKNHCFSDFLNTMRLLDILSYLPDDILTKVDRASMAVSLEVRVPLLDHRLVALAWQWPSQDLIYQGRGKQPLRRILTRYLPKHLVERPKQGFSVPLNHWLRGPLRDWAESLLTESALANPGFFAPELIRSQWQQLLDGRGEGHYALWNVLMFQAWYQHWYGSGSGG